MWMPPSATTCSPLHACYILIMPAGIKHRPTSSRTHMQHHQLPVLHE